LMIAKEMVYIPFWSAAPSSLVVIIWLVRPGSDGPWAIQSPLLVRYSLE
jgi:hypothetical protein